MKCPQCNKENDDNWPLRINNKIVDGGCLDCWEDECDKSWWKNVIAINKLLLEGEGRKVY